MTKPALAHSKNHLSSFLPITLGVRRKSGTEFVSKGRIDTASVWRQDNFTCQFCGFRAEKFQRVVNGAWCGDKRQALTACLYCEQCFTLETAGLTGAGSLIWLPEISQADLHHLCRAISVARQQSALAERAQMAFDALMSRRAEAKKRLGTDDPLALGTVMLENLSAKDYAQRTARLEGIRFLPLDRYLVNTPEGVVDQFPAVLDYWQSAQGPFGKIPVTEWLDRFAAAA